MTQRDAPSSEGNLCSVFDTGTFCLECVTGHNWGGGEGHRGKGGEGVRDCSSPDGAEPVAGPIHVTVINGTCHFGLWWSLNLFLAWSCPPLSSFGGSLALGHAVGW